MSTQWPDKLSRAETSDVTHLLAGFWLRLAELADLVNAQEHLLCAELTAGLRETVVDMVLALNGIERPPATRNLNSYLSAKQRVALEKTLLAPATSGDTWIAQAVALVVVYRWYAPQLVEAYGCAYPGDLEEATLRRLSDALPNWPRAITTE